MIAKIDSLLAHRTETVGDTLAQISRDLADLADHAGRVLGSSHFGTVAITVHVARDVFDGLPGYVVHVRDRTDKGEAFDSKIVAPGVYVYCFDVAAP